jgi:hypothetical protein
MHQSSLDQGRVADELSFLPHQGMQSTEAVLPIVVSQLPLENVLEEVASRRQDSWGQLSGVPEDELGHAAILSVASTGSEIQHTLEPRTSGTAQRQWPSHLAVNRASPSDRGSPTGKR